VLVLGATVQISLDALRWLDALSIPLVVLDPETLKPTFTSVPHSADDARLPRAQAFAPVEATGVEIARRLLGAKIRGEAANLRDRLGRPDLATELDSLIGAIAAAETIEEAGAWRPWPQASTGRAGPTTRPPACASQVAAGPARPSTGWGSKPAAARWPRPLATEVPPNP
jgi:hypothetical protein